MARADEAADLFSWDVALQAVIEHSPDAILIKDLGGTYRLANPAAGRLMERTAAQILGRTDAELFPAEIASWLHAKDLEVIATGETLTYDFALPRTDGQECVVHAIKYPYRTPDGRMLGVIVTVRDITERNRVEEALRDRERLLAEAEALADMGSWEVDLRTGAATWSAQLYRLYGLDPATTVASPEAMLATVHPDDRAYMRAQMARHARELAPFELERRIVRPDGTVRVIHTRGRYIRGADGRPTKLIGTSQDVTERKQAEQRLTAALRELERMGQLKDEFLSTVSHEFRTPLSVIKNAATILRRGTAGPLNGEQARFLAMILDYGDRLAHMVDDLLDLQKLRAGVPREPLAPGDVIQVARYAVGDLVHVFEANDIELVVALDEGPAYARIARDKLVQALHNLLANAAKFTPAGGRVTLHGGRRGREVVIAVSDTGAGIAPADLPRVFKPFEQVDAGPTRDHGGSGLGLAICKALVEELHGGRLWAESTPGRGSTFSIALPAVEPAAAPS